MPHRQAPFRSGNYYHIYNRGVARQPIFFERENYAYFLRQHREYLVEGSSKTQSPHAVVIAYCLMPNHFHLLTKLVSDDFSQAMQSFGQSYSKAINKRFNRVGPLFAGHFQAKYVDDDSYLLHLSRYIHLNPVTAGLVPRPQDWEFSSYLEFIGERSGTLPTPELIIAMVGSNESYRQFVLEGVQRPDVKIQHLLFDET